MSNEQLYEMLVKVIEHQSASLRDLIAQHALEKHSPGVLGGTRVPLGGSTFRSAGEVRGADESNWEDPCEPPAEKKEEAKAAQNPKVKLAKTLNAFDGVDVSKPTGPDASKVKTAFSSRNASVYYEDIESKARFLDRVSKTFDMAMGVLIILSIGFMFAEMQFEGQRAAVLLGLKSPNSVWALPATDVFDIADKCFNSLFVVELIVQLHRGGLTYLKAPANFVDACVVILNSIASLILEPLDMAFQSFLVARLLRIVRLVRVFKAFRSMVHFSELRVLLRTMQQSFMALVWSMLLLGSMITAFGIFMAQLMADIVVDEGYDYDFRLWVYQHYGDAGRAMWTVFEATLSGGWPSRVRPIIENYSVFIVIVWGPYVVLVWFATVRIIAALFLKKTMQVAATDSEMMSMEKLRQKETFTAKLNEFFLHADTSGDGMMNAEEFENAMCDPMVRSWLQVLDLEVYEVTALFNLLDDGDGEISFDEFLGGCLRLKGNARSIDAIAIMHEQHKLGKGLDLVNKAIGHLTSSSDPSVAA